MSTTCSNTTMIVLGKLQLNSQTHELIINQQRHRLRYKLFHLMRYLAEHPNQLITRQTLIDEVWRGNYYIGEKGLTHAVCMLRSLLKQDESYSVRIETIPKTGYQLRIFDHESAVVPKQEAAPAIAIDTSVPAWWPTTKESPKKESLQSLA